MAEKTFYVEENSNLRGYDVLKRDGVDNGNGTSSPERILTLYSMEYLDVIVSALNYEDGLSETGEQEFVVTPVFERDAEE